MKQYLLTSILFITTSLSAEAATLSVCISSNGKITASTTCPRGTTKLTSNSIKNISHKTIPSGTTVYGVIGGRYEARGVGESFDAFSSLPAKTAQIFDNENDVQVGITPAIDNDCSGGTCLTAEENDVASRCTGSPENPTAPSGVVCIYPTGNLNARFLVGFNIVNGFNPTTPNAPSPSDGAVGFGLGWESVASGSTLVEAVWAYTAP